ncbi:hypothetical protein ACN6MY_13190 [Peribacillus sp. B-H-3]|uniref:hypothetical protein n=1 Tax=Peribacillus sp. B-H-3 TaxID=3400420 RepID=UPI003B024D75
MRKLQKPKFTPLNVLLTCISNYEDDDLVKRMKSIGNKIEEASNTFEKKVKSKTLHTLEPHEGVSVIVTHIGNEKCL